MDKKIKRNRKFGFCSSIGGTWNLQQKKKALNTFKIFYTFIFASHRPRQISEFGTGKTKNSCRLLKFVNPPPF